MTRKERVFNEALINELAKDCKTQDGLFGPEEIFKQADKSRAREVIKCGINKSSRL